MKLLMTIYATIDNAPIKVKALINARSHNDKKIEKIYDHFFKQNADFLPAHIKDNRRPMYKVESEFNSDDFPSIKYSNKKGITGKFKIIVPSLQYKL